MKNHLSEFFSFQAPRWGGRESTSSLLSARPASLPAKLTASALAAAALASLAVAGVANWQTWEYLRASGSEPIDADNALFIYFDVEDWSPNWVSSYSSAFFARAHHRHYIATGGFTDEYYYRCDHHDGKASGVARIPDNSSMIGPNRAWGFTFDAPACDGYPAATFTVQCDANDTVHSVETTSSKETYPDGSKRFFTKETERVKAAYDEGVGGYTCTMTFDNGEVRIELHERTYAAAFVTRRREQ